MYIYIYIYSIPRRIPTEWLREPPRRSPVATPCGPCYLLPIAIIATIACTSIIAIIATIVN